MTPLEDCIAECGVNAPLYTVPCHQYPKPMVVRYLGTDEDYECIMCQLDTPFKYAYNPDGSHLNGREPDIAPVMPKPGERWVTADGRIMDVYERPHGQLMATDGDRFDYRIDRWGRYEHNPKCNLILPYIQPHD